MTNIKDIYVRPCVDGNSSTGQTFNFSAAVTLCQGEDCASLDTLPGASITSPIVLAFTGVSGQVVAIIYLHGSYRRPARQRTMFYVMLATLIWKDLIGKLLTTPQAVISYYYGHWVGGATACMIHGYCMSIVGMLTHQLVAAMALERFLGIKYGYFYNRAVTLYRTRLILVTLLLFSLLYCGLPVVGIGEFRIHYPGSWCHIDQHMCADFSLTTKVFGNIYTLINLICLFFIVYFNFIVVETLLKRRLTKSSKMSIHGASSRNKARERELQMVVLLVVITLSFLLSWLPHDFLMIVNQLWPTPPNENPILDLTAIRLVAFNQILEPWSYIICRLIFRSKLWKRFSARLLGTLETTQLIYERSRLHSVLVSSSRLSSIQSRLRRISTPAQRDMAQHNHNGGSDGLIVSNDGWVPCRILPKFLAQNGKLKVHYSSSFMHDTADDNTSRANNSTSGSRRPLIRSSSWCCSDEYIHDSDL